MCRILNVNHIDFRQEIENSCIPAGYEWLLKYYGYEGIDFNDFQQRYLMEDAHFHNISNAIMRDYPNINITWELFQSPENKMERIKSLINNDTPCLISIPVNRNGFHIHPVFGYSETELYAVQGDGHTIMLAIDDILNFHRRFKGGHELSWIEND